MTRRLRAAAGTIALIAALGPLPAGWSPIGPDREPVVAGGLTPPVHGTEPVTEPVISDRVPGCPTCWV